MGTRSPSKPSYINSYDTFKRGLNFQEFIAWLFGIINYHTLEEQYNIGENPLGMEIKLDSRCTDKNHFWIECFERTNINYSWTPSGIWRDDNSILYAQGNKDLIARFKKKDLQALDISHGVGEEFFTPPYEEQALYKQWWFPFSRSGEYSSERATGAGIVLPFEDAKTIAIDWREITPSDIQRYRDR